ncbi:MAG: homoserine dehydrogenase [Calditrichia bacterium]|nr:homoserine dehydrogenase [Calditrichia bacterium]
MPKRKQINFALLGCGKLGHGIFELWKNNHQKIINQTGVDLNLKYILVKHTNYKRHRMIPKELITDKVEKILKDESVQVVIDAIGGIEPTYSIIKKFVEKGCHLVSANRALLSSKLKEVFDLAKEKQIHLRFEAAIGGGIPLVKTLRRDLIAAKINSMWGIVSGSANYILTKMTQDNCTLKEVLKSPQLKELTEGYMMLDYEGVDAAQKIALVSATIFGAEISDLNIYAEGISNLTPFDIKCAKRYGYEFKLLAIIKDKKEGLELRVHPTLVPLNHPLTSVINDYIAFYVKTDIIGEFMVYGKGAGIYPVASVIIRDLVDIATTIKTSTKYMYEFPLWNSKNILPIGEIYSGYYIRVHCSDQPGVMGKIAKILGDYKININAAYATAEKREKKQNQAYVHIFINHAQEKDIQVALNIIQKLDVVQGRPAFFRIIDEEMYGDSNS